MSNIYLSLGKSPRLSSPVPCSDLCCCCGPGILLPPSQLRGARARVSEVRGSDS